MSSVEQHFGIAHRLFHPRREERPVTHIEPAQPIRALVLDYDATVAPSYLTLQAMHYALLASDADPKEFADAHRDSIHFQSFLHDPECGRIAVQRWVWENKGRPVSPSVVGVMQQMQDQAAEIYPIVTSLLKKAHAAGTSISIYTNSQDAYMMRKLDDSPFHAHWFDAVYASRNPRLGHVDMPKTHWREKLISYDTFSKPSNTPLLQIREKTGISDPREIMMVGEGLNDLISAYHNPAEPAAHFCYQEQGAHHISTEQKTMNGHLRPGKESLGPEPVERKLAELKLGAGQFTRLTEGFRTMADLILDGTLVLQASPRKPVVENNRLTAPARRDFVAPMGWRQYGVAE